MKDRATKNAAESGRAMARHSAHPGLLILVLILGGGMSPLMAQGRGSSSCTAWGEHKARLEAEGKGRGPWPSPFHTGMLIRATVNVVAGTDGGDLAKVLQKGTFVIGVILCDSPAAAAGLRLGDQIVTVNGRLPHEPGVLPTLQYPRREGDTFLVKVRRGADTLGVTVTSVPRPQ